MKLSIITINYNNAQGLQKTLESIRVQTFTDYEQIIIDGGSTDESLEIIKNYETKFNIGQLKIKNYQYISEKDTGIYNAQNKAILKAKGEYCLFLNSGDYFTGQNVLERVFAANPTADIIWGNLIVLDRGNVIVSKGKEKLTFFDVYSSKIKHQASFIKRSLFDKYGLYDESLKIVADWAFFFKTVGFNNVPLQYLDINIACFENNGFSNNNPEICKTERQRVLDQYMPRIMQEDYLLLSKYRGIKNIEKSKLGWLLFRILAKFFK